MDQLKKKKMKRTIVTAEGESPFWGGLVTCAPKEIHLQMRPFGIIQNSRPFHKFFFHLLKSKNLTNEEEEEIQKLLETL